MTGMTRLVLAGTAAALVAAVSLVGGVLRGHGGAARAVPVEASAAGDSFAAGFSGGDTASFVNRLVTDLRAHPGDAKGYTLLGLAYQQRARETGNPAYYTKSEQALQRARHLAPGDATTVGALGSLALARHRFGEALVLGREAVRLAPYTARSYGVRGDALIELGRYEEAFRTFDRMSSLRPDLSSYSRVSYARELLGRPAAAEQAMKLALDAAGGQPEPTAWVETQLGKLAWSRGRLGRGGVALPGGALDPSRLRVRARAARARPGGKGRNRAALSLARRAAEALPLPQTVATLGDLYALHGRPRAAKRQYALVGVIQRLLVANGVRTDLEIAQFDADHGVDPRAGAPGRRKARRARPSIDGDDVLGWALERNGRCAEALPYSRRALRLGTHDALKYFHRGMIERCLGHESRSWFARALRLNPHFSLLWSPVARRYAS